MRRTHLMTSPHAKREAIFATLCLVATIILYWMVFDYTAHKVYDSYFFPNPGPFYGGIIYIISLGILFYGMMLYNICLIGNYLRQLKEKIPSDEEVATLFDATAPALTVLIPSYKEEKLINWQTMMSAALSEYPHKNVVLLIDNPPNPKNEADILQLEQARALPVEMQEMFAQQHQIYRKAADAFAQRNTAGTLDVANEWNIIADLYESVAAWLEFQAKQFMYDQPIESLPFDIRFFVETILLTPAQLRREAAAVCRQKSDSIEATHIDEIHHHYAFLSGLFNVTFSSFERKKYANFSHDANKAMNLNSYIKLIGFSWKEVQTERGLVLRKCAPEEATFSVPYADYINTIDADSLMTHDYVSRLIYFMHQPENHRVAVAQAPCSSIPGSPIAIERAAGAVIDVQYHTHQGYTYWYASFWVGANAMLRMTALQEIKERVRSGGKTVTIFIQDRTVIEDTESTIDLVHKGWKLYNYPARMTFSAMPSDFGSLLIQRRRWANGGLIILPKLLHYAIHAPKNLRLLQELFMRFNYLAMTTLSVAVMMLFAFYNFSPRLGTPLLIYANIPLLLLVARDLKICGYRYSDLWRVASLNLMLLPVLTAGVLKQMQQIITGKKIPFGRTPKVKDRTGAPAIYYIIQLFMIGYCLYMAYDHADENEWSHAIFALVNMIMLLYALVYFIGIRHMLQDLLASLKSLFKTSSA